MHDDDDDDDEHDSMSDREFDALLTQRMRERGIPTGIRDSKGRLVTLFRGPKGETPEDKSLEAWLDGKEYRDEVFAALGSRIRFDESF